MTRTPQLRGVGAILVRDGRVLVGLRRGGPATGTWSFAGGKVEPGETAIETAERELFEETGLRGANPRLVAFQTIGEVEPGVEFETRFVVLDWVAGEPAEPEPHKCGDWQWRDWNNLPEPLFAPVAALIESGFASWEAGGAALRSTIESVSTIESASVIESANAVAPAA